MSYAVLDANDGSTFFHARPGLVGVTAGAACWLGRRGGLEAQKSIGVARVAEPGKLAETRGIYVQIGSSITADLHVPGAYVTPLIVGTPLNLTPINVGFDGGYAGTLNHPFFDAVSLCGLVDAITSGDWSRQEKVIAADDTVNAPILSRIESIDFSKVTYLALEYGTNEFTVGMPIGADNDGTPETFKGALNYAMRKMFTSFPLLRIFLIASAWRLNFEELDSDTHPNEKGIFLKAYVDAMAETAMLKPHPLFGFVANPRSKYLYLQKPHGGWNSPQSGRSVSIR
jgi:hypothetical protein